MAWRGHAMADSRTTYHRRIRPYPRSLGIGDGLKRDRGSRSLLRDQRLLLVLLRVELCLRLRLRLRLGVRLSK